MSTAFFPDIPETAYSAMRQVVPELPEKYSGWQFFNGNRVAEHGAKSPNNDFKMIDVSVAEVKAELAKDAGRQKASIGDIDRVAQSKGMALPR